MGYTPHGIDLAAGLILRPGSKFKRTRAGFDTGTRTYTCDRSVTELLAPQIGDSDLILPEGQHVRMFVDDVDIDEGRNDIDTLTITFLGLLGAGGSGGKAPIISGDTNTSQFLVAGLYSVTDITPSISVAYVQETTPDPWTVGQKQEPPIGVRETPYTPVFGDYGPINYAEPIFQDWILAKRNFRQAGPLWELTDTFEYLIINAPEAE